MASLKHESNKDLAPALWSLDFVTKVNTGVSMAIKRALQQGKAVGDSDKQIGDAASRIYKLLWDGEYEDEAGKRRRARGDISKINRIVGLTDTEKALVQNYHFMSAKIAGTRQVRRQINHNVFSARIVYGCQCS
jgi:hypothetical protein